MEPIVSAQSLSCTLPDGARLLDDVNLAVEPGECVLLCGRSGAGKTTLTKCLNGIIPNFEPAVTRTGSVTVCGKDPAFCEAYELALEVGNVFQNPKSQFFNLTSDDELAFGLEVAGAAPDDIDERVARTVEALSIEGLRGRNVNHMSGGEKQSLVFASVEVADPKLYILDEPTANLDRDATVKIREQIEAALSEGKTVIVAEHRLGFIADLVTRAVLVEGGRITRTMTAEELLALSPEELEELGLRDPGQRSDVVLAAKGVPAVDAAQDMPVTPAAGGAAGILRVQGLSVARQKVEVFSPVSFDVAPGTVLGIVGANGSGKTTMLRALAGLERHARGIVELGGAPLSRRQRRHRFAYVMQDVNHQLFADSVLAECELSIPGDAPDADAAAQIAEVLARLDLAGKEDVHPMALSGGQKQRLAIASCLLARREVLLMDEPTSGLDFSHMMEVTALLRTLAGDGLTVCVVTHDGEFLERACDCVVEINGGRP